MIHDELTRHFRDLPAPALSPEFGVHLRESLARARPSRRFSVRASVFRWASRLYWIGAAVLVIREVRPPSFSPAQMMAMAILASLAVLAAQRALRPAQLTKIVRDALLR